MRGLEGCVVAGGIDWFRWHHGSVNDPKFQLVAKRSRSSVAEVIAVWASLLEAASMAEKRGAAGAIDHEALDCALGLDDGQSVRIVDAIRARNLTHGEDCQITAWEKRQPKRERDDESAADRKRAQRAREAAAATGVTDGVTPSHATSHGFTPRGEERRVEEITPSVEGVPRATPGEACKAMREAGMANVSPSNPKLGELLKAGITIAELADAARDSVAAGKPFAYALSTAEGRRRDAATAPLPEARASPAETNHQRISRERMERIVPGIAAKAPGVIDENVIEMEVPSVIANCLGR